MRKNKFLIVFVCLLCIYSCSQKKNSSEIKEQTFLKEYYFNQKPPGLTPVVFAPGKISLPGRVESFAAYSPSGDRFYYQAGDTVLYMDFKNNEWSQPAIATFIGKNGICKYLRISSDGNTIIYNSGGDLYATKRLDDTWSEPIKFPDQVNSDRYECVACLTDDQSIYYASQRDGTKGQCDIFYSKYVDGEYQSPVPVEAFNTFRSECNVLISPNNNFIIFTCFENEDSYGSSDMYISYSLDEGNCRSQKIWAKCLIQNPVIRHSLFPPMVTISFFPE